MTGKTLAITIGLSVSISAGALAAGPAGSHGAAFSAGGVTLQRHFPQRGIGVEGLTRRRFWPGRGLGAYPYYNIEPYAFPDYSDFEPICGFTWVDHIFGSRIVRHRVYTCS